MLIVGELINTSRKPVREAVERRDAGYIQQVAKQQEEGGAHYLDVNCGTMVSEEVPVMEWLVETVQGVTDLPLCIDSPSARALEAGLRLVKAPAPLVNSISAEEKRFHSILPLVEKFKAKVVALCIDDGGMPATAEDRLRIAEKLVTSLEAAGVARENIYLDPVIKPVSTGNKHGWEVLQSIRLIKEKFPEVHLICGLSNISFGLPNRALLNRLFMVQTMSYGMDAYILDPTDKAMMGALYASMALLGQDRYCAGYLKVYRKGLYV